MLSDEIPCAMPCACEKDSGDRIAFATASKTARSFFENIIINLIGKYSILRLFNTEVY